MQDVVAKVIITINTCRYFRVNEVEVNSLILFFKHRRTGLRKYVKMVVYRPWEPFTQVTGFTWDSFCISHHISKLCSCVFVFFVFADRQTIKNTVVCFVCNIFS